MEKLKSISRPQNYSHNYSKVLLTGLLGCRWHRYKQSTRPNRKRDLFGFAITVISFLFVCFITYIWRILYNDNYSMVIHHTLEWPVSFYILGLALMSTCLAYHCIVFMLCLFHIHLGFQLYIHPLLQAISVVIIALCTAVVIILSIYHPLWWNLLTISLKVVGPFLDVGAIVFLTLVGFVLTKQWYLTSWKKGKWVAFVILSGLMLCLYMAPLFIHSPLVSDTRPAKPGVVAYGGACFHAPENSELAFRKALRYRVQGLLIHVQFSLDSIPFVFEHTSLTQLTDAESVFPGAGSYSPSSFTMQELKRLSIGAWFIDNDPFDTVEELSTAEKVNISASKILTFQELLAVAADSLVPISLYVLETSVTDDTAKRKVQLGNVSALLAKSNYSLAKVFWGRSRDGTGPNNTFPLQDGDTPLVQGMGTGLGNNMAVYLDYDEAAESVVRKYTDQNATVLVGKVNTDWMKTYFQFLGVDGIAARHVSAMMHFQGVVWSLSEKHYMALWISLDFVSLLLIIGFFIFHRIRIFGTNFSPESISLNAGRTLQYRSRTMKEKLLREGAVIDTLEDTEMQDRGMDNNQQAYSVASFRNMDVSVEGNNATPQLVSSKASNPVFST